MGVAVNDRRMRTAAFVLVCIAAGCLMTVTGCERSGAARLPGYAELSSHADEYAALCAAPDPSASTREAAARVGKLVVVSADGNRLDDSLYESLSVDVKAISDAEVGTIAYVRRGYISVGTYQDGASGGATGEAKQDVVEIYLVDRKTREQLWYQRIYAPRPPSKAVPGGVHSSIDPQQLTEFFMSLPDTASGSR